MGVSSDQIYVTEMKMMLTTFPLIVLLCVLPPFPVASENLMEHVQGKQRIIDMFINMFSSGCPSDWTPFNGSCHKYFGVPLKWSEARNTCLDLEADLASIHSEEENDFVASLTGGNYCWLGGYRYDPCTGCTSCPNCGFLWTDGTPRNFNNWGGPPSNSHGDEYCMGLNGAIETQGNWNDVPCDRTDLGRFVCKKPMN